MYTMALRRLLEMYPAGASSEQLLYHLRTSGTRATAADILQSLNILSGSGEAAIVAQNRWQLSKFQSRNPAQNSNDPLSKNSLLVGRDSVLFAASGRILSKPSSGFGLEDASSPGSGSNEEGAWHLDSYWRNLLSYYAATQRADPRGKVTQFADRHGEAWQLFTLRGCWWKNADLRFTMESLPECFREALTRRKEKICALGYPVSVFDSSGVAEFIPAMLITASWRVNGDAFEIDVDASTPVINPDWLKKVCSTTSWEADDLSDALIPVDEDDDLAAIAPRLRNAIARTGGDALSPANPSGSLVFNSDGARNCAAVFLSDNARFTQGTAADLDAMAAWDVEDFQRSGLHQLLSGDDPAHQTETVPPEIPLVQAREMTDRQFQAAQTALAGPLTVIQGPPGTGKSDVVVSLLVSIFMAGRTVLFASKNHQALDEVEARLSKLVGTYPVLTRGRDAEGDRDTNFLEALRAVSSSEPRIGSSPPAINDLVEAAKAEAENWAVRASRADLETQLAGLIEQSLSAGSLRLSPKAAPGLLKRLWNFIVRWFQRTSISDNKDTTSKSTKGRIDDLRERIRSLPASKPIALYDAVSDRHSVQRQFIERYANFVTKIDPSQRQVFLDRIAELEFTGVTKSKKLLGEDARLLLKHRPIWAISTLSVPSRVPLVAGLFDYVVVDEASQCDVASALPLIGRARQTVVVGDPMQLSFIPQLSREQEHALMDAAGIPKTRRHLIAQSVNSLFDFAQKRPLSRQMFLADQFRSAFGIVDYVNGEFYGGRLIARREDDELVTPRDYKPGLEWRDVKGQTGWEDGGNINAIEADAVASLIGDLVRVHMFSGSIGVVSPFTAQVGRLSRLTSQLLTEEERSRVALKVATIDKFQGGEADVIVFSPVIAGGASFGIVNFLRRERRRLNVAISRARALCIVVGDLDYASKSDIPHIRNLAHRATSSSSPPREGFDSEWERKLDAAIRRRGLEPHSQYPVGRKYLDFALFAPGVKLDVEVDGRVFHVDADGNRKTSDLLRDKELTARGWKVRRFWVSELHFDMESCVDRIESDLRQS